MKTFVAILVAGTLAAANPLAAAVDCGGCSGSLNCPAPPPCPRGATHVAGSNMSVIQNAINVAAPGAVICVAPGTYVGNLNFHGKPVTVKSSRPLGAVLHGGIVGTPVVTFASNEGAGSVLDGFVITGGSAPAGGGILIVKASPLIQNCLIKENTATNTSYPRGGGVAVVGSFAAPSILCSCFQNNHADFAGGGLVSAYFAHPYLDNDTFAGNTASYGGGYSSVFSGLANIENSTFFDNSATDGAGLHIATQFGSTLVRRTILQGNKASGIGGGAWVPAGFATFLNSVFDSNSAGEGGGAATGYDGVLSVESSIFVHNATSYPTSATLTADASPAGTTLINDFNLFFGNTGGIGATLNTPGNLGILTGDPLFAGCYVLGAGSPALHTGIPDYHFNNSDGTPNTMGIYGGPVTP
jgi:hypothetical protein